MKPNKFPFIVALTVSMLLDLSLFAQEPTPLYKAGEDGYACYRIPAVVVTNSGTLLAFAEARKTGCGDAGDIDLVVKRSSDEGKSWSKLMVVWDDAENTCGNPSPVVDQQSGNIILVSTWNLGKDHEKQIINGTSLDTRRIFVLTSADDGTSWSKAKEITADVKKPGWTWYATGPCHGIQLRQGRFAGRLIVPCDHIESVTNKYFSHIIYSDDRGKTWNLGGSTPQDQVNECTVAELSAKKLMLNMRNYNRTEKSRKVSVSKDGGSTWSDIYTDKTLVEPICQGSLLTYSGQKRNQHKLLFLNPADENKRKNMTLRISYNNGKSWAKSKILYPGPAAYADMTQLPNGNIGCLYEAGSNSPYQEIIYQTVSLRDL
jgi:sialidase-1